MDPHILVITSSQGRGMNYTKKTGMGSDGVTGSIVNQQKYLILFKHASWVEHGEAQKDVKMAFPQIISL